MNQDMPSPGKICVGNRICDKYGSGILCNKFCIVYKGMRGKEQIKSSLFLVTFMAFSSFYDDYGYVM